MKNQREIKGPRKVDTNAIIGRRKKMKNKAPDSQTAQATCRTKEIDRAQHRSHSTREAKQNKNKQVESSITNQDNKIA